MDASRVDLSDNCRTAA